MSRLTDLLRQAHKMDPQLASDLESEIGALAKRRTFGLVFERHQPEAVELPSRAVARGDKVRILPPRGTVGRGDQRLWRVKGLRADPGGRVAHLELVDLGTEGMEERVVNVDDLVPVAEFRDTVYPGLVETGRIERGGDKPFHTVINAENFHALEMLTYTHRHSIDICYLDPPFNTGAKDWKYNNNYVDENDGYRHSKWLAFMDRRLKIARELLRPDDSVLIVAIDEKEYLRLGLLLEQVFPGGRITMVTSSTNAAGATRKGTFARAAEYLYFVQFGSSRPAALPLDAEWNAVQTDNKSDLYWSRLIRSGDDSARSDSPNQFYPVVIRNTVDGPVFGDIGDTFFGDRDTFQAPKGSVAVWPIRKDGTEGRWRVSARILRGLLSEGHVRLGRWRDGATTVYYLKKGESQKVTDGVLPAVGYRGDGSVITDATEYEPRFVPTDVWRLTSHDAGNSGSRLVARMLPRRKFPYPKSLYAVEDALRFFVTDKPGATVLDFFAGSGTTAHAVMRLNKQDGGTRQSILVTNNEVSVDEQNRLRRAGLRPGDPEWEALGICDYVTTPRITSAITGSTPDGDPIGASYKFNEQFGMSDGFTENAAFFRLTYQSPLAVRHHRAFARIAPMLWLRAGSQGRVITCLGERGWDVADRYGVLGNLDLADDFTDAVVGAVNLRLAFIVTDDESAFQMVCRDLPAHVTTVRLYESYLQNFQINTGRSR